MLEEIQFYNGLQKEICLPIRWDASGKLKKYCSNEGNIYTESLGQLAYQNNPKFKKFIADNSLGFKAYASFGKNEITERITVLVDLVKLVWNDDMFK